VHVSGVPLTASEPVVTSLLCNQPYMSVQLTTTSHPPTPDPHAPPPTPRHKSTHSTSLADVVYAEAQMGWADQRLAELVADYATDNIETFDAASLTRLLAGLASVG